MKTIYICCPAASYTGGPTLAHQLCYVLNENGFDAKMWYFCSKHKRNRIDPVHSGYKHFNNPYTFDNPEDSENVIIVAIESRTHILREYKKAKRIIWWMSVDNYFLNMGNIFEVIKRRFFKFQPTLEYSKRFKDKPKYQVFKELDVLHFVQSEYARLFLLGEGISSNRIFDLGDYIEEEVIKAHQLVDKNNKEDIILYNPKKGFEFTKKIIELKPQYEWIPLIGMNKSEIIEYCLKAKLYIDFGNHPGKDRFPREAVLCGCCVITGLRGAANNDIDIPISNEYKFADQDENLLAISQKIEEVVQNYEMHWGCYDEYCIRTLGEKEKFINDAINLFKNI